MMPAQRTSVRNHVELGLNDAWHGRPARLFSHQNTGGTPVPRFATVNSLFAFAFAFLIAASVAHSAEQTIAPATTQPSTQPTGFDVRDWVVLIVDAQNRANARGAWPSTLPPFVSSRRGTAEAGATTQPSPVGVIRLFGTVDAKSPIDVLVNLPGGETEATWPRAQTKSGRLLWANLVPADADTKPAAVDTGEWFAGLRGGDAVVMQSDTQAESFLMYDVSLPLTTPLRLRAEGDTLLATNGGPTPLLDLTFYKRRGATWTQATLDSLPGVPAPLPTTTKADPAAAFDPPTTAPASRPATTTAATKPATTGPASRPAGTAVRLAPVVAADAEALVAPWNSRLLAAGVPESDIGTVLRILADRALDDRWLTAVYRIGPTDLDRLLPLEVVPSPRSTTRVGLVIVRGIDPAISGEIDRLIAQCGDADYAVRKNATAALIALGAPAKAKLTTAVNNADPEISQRAEAILAAIAKAKGN